MAHIEIGDPNAPTNSHDALLFEEGVNLYGRAGIVRGIVQILFSAIYPKLLQCGIPPGHLFAYCFSAFSIVILIYARTNSALLAQIGVILYALPLAAILTLPIGLTMALSDETNRGRHLGALNVFAVVPQLIDTT